jgi:uncharacterized membrane protein
VNGSGDIVGSLRTDNGLQHQAVIWRSGGTTQVLGTSGVNSYAYGVNDLGQVVGRESGVGAMLWDTATGQRHD